MRRFTNYFWVGLFLCLTFVSFSFAQPPERDLKKEEKLWQQLQKNAPKAVETFKAATIALDAKDYQKSIELYNQVLSQDPTCEAALRRLGHALAATGKRDEGLKTSQTTLDFSRAPDNLISHAMILAGFDTLNYKPTDVELRQAFALSKEAMQKDTENDSDYPLMVAQLALTTNRYDEFLSASDILNKKFPDVAATHYFNGIRLANDGDLDAAETEVKRAEALGMPNAATQDLLAAIETEQNSGFNLIKKYLFYGLYFTAAWAIGLLILFVAGKILSAKTLRSIETSDPNDIHGKAQAGLRNIYKKIIGIAGVYYYLSQPFVMFLVIVAAGAITLFFVWIGTIPIKLVLIVGFVALASVFYMVKSLFSRTKNEDPGRILSEAEAPELWTLAREVAKTIDTRPVNEIRITHGTELAVYERGGWRDRMQDNAERILIVGLATLNGFSQNAFRAVLAHEYGHFSNRDTAGGDIAMRVNTDIIRLAESMAISGTATFYNVAFQFLRFYHFLFRRITHGASRLQEILADRVAVYQYGADAFREGLTHVIRRDIEFNLVADREINAALSSNRALQNLYEMTEQNEEIKKGLEQQYNEHVARPTTEDDTHPSAQDRFKFASQIKSRDIAPLNGMVWDFFLNRESLTVEMNSTLESRIKAMM